MQAKDKDAALEKTIELGIHPAHDDICILEISDPELEPDRLYTKAEMKAKDYDSVSFNPGI